MINFEKNQKKNIFIKDVDKYEINVLSNCMKISYFFEARYNN